MPKGFNWCEFKHFVDAYDKDLVELELWKYYLLKHWSKKQQSKEYCFVRLYLNGNLYLDSYIGDLSNSDGDGRVVVEKMK
jgi:hypothetical protein